MSRDEIITKLYSDNRLRGIIRAMCNRYGKSRYMEDMLQFLFTKLSEQPHERIVQLETDQRLSYFCYGIIRNQLDDKYSQFNKLTAEHDELQEYDLTEDPVDEIKLFGIDDFKNHCLKKTQSENGELSLAAKVTYGYIIYKPNGKKTYRNYAKETQIHYSSICQYVKLMRQTFLNEKYKVSSK